MGKYESNRREPAEAGVRKQPTAQQIASRRKAIKNQRIAIIVGCSVLLVLITAIIIGILVGGKGQKDDGKILPNVYAAGINLGGMTRQEATNALHLVTDNTFSVKDMAINLPDDAFSISAIDSGALLDVDAVVNAALNYGRTGSQRDYEKAYESAKNTTHTIALLPYLELDMDYIQSTIRTYCQTYGSSLTQPSAKLEGTRPAYDPEYPDLYAEHQTLVITMGTPEYALDATKICNKVLDAYSLNQFSVTYEAPTLTEPNKPDVDDLFRKFCIAPADALLDDVTFEVTPEVYGYGFDHDSLQRRLEVAEYGEEIRVQLDFILPDVTAKSLTASLFKDILAEYTLTSPNASTELAVNLDLSAMAINGMVIKAGEEFSFNNIMGRPTAQKGYLDVTELRGGKFTQVLGGGVSQTASVLYYCALVADLDILERHNNEYAVDYAPLGQDAFVDWGARDLRLRNNTGAPIRIIASASGGEVTIRLLGENTRSYEVDVHSEVMGETLPETVTQLITPDNVYGYTDGQVLQSGISGYEVQTSIDKIDVRTGQVLSSTLVDYSTYKKQDEVVIKIYTGEEPTEPSDPEDPTEPSAPTDITDPTEDTEAPTEVGGFPFPFFP